MEGIRAVLEVPEIQGQVKDAHEFHDALTIDRLGYVGPLRHPNSIKVDVSFRETVQRAPRETLLSTPYVPPFVVTCMALEEILAEKIRAALMRRAPRDYFDLWLLFQQDDISFDTVPDLARAKLDTVDHPYDPSSLWESPDVLKRLWSEDLRQLMRDVPPFDTAYSELQALFEVHMPERL